VKKVARHICKCSAGGLLSSAKPAFIVQVIATELISATELHCCYIFNVPLSAAEWHACTFSPCEYGENKSKQKANYPQ